MCCKFQKIALVVLLFFSFLYDFPSLGVPRVSIRIRQVSASFHPLCLQVGLSTTRDIHSTHRWRNVYFYQEHETRTGFPEPREYERNGLTDALASRFQTPEAVVEYVEGTARSIQNALQNSLPSQTQTGNIFTLMLVRFLTGDERHDENIINQFVSDYVNWRHTIRSTFGESLHYISFWVSQSHHERFLAATIILEDVINLLSSQNIRFDIVSSLTRPMDFFPSVLIEDGPVGTIGNIARIFRERTGINQFLFSPYMSVSGPQGAFYPGEPPYLRIDGLSIARGRPSYVLQHEFSHVFEWIAMRRRIFRPYSGQWRATIAGNPLPGRIGMDPYAWFQTLNEPKAFRVEVVRIIREVINSRDPTVSLSIVTLIMSYVRYCHVQVDFLRSLHHGINNSSPFHIEFRNRSLTAQLRFVLSTEYIDLEGHEIPLAQVQIQENGWEMYLPLVRSRSVNDSDNIRHTRELVEAQIAAVESDQSFIERAGELLRQLRSAQQSQRPQIIESLRNHLLTSRRD